MATQIDRYNPTFSLFPIQNARTAWKPVYIPVVLAVPYRRDAEGDTIDKSDVFNVKFFIEDAPGQAKVAGYKNQGILVPDYERFVVNISDILGYKVDLTGQVFIDQNTGAEKTYSEANDGDEFYLSLMNGGVRDKITFYEDADYYDFSPITIETIDLKPHGQYNFVWQATYYERVMTPDDEVYCISDYEKVSRFSILFNHPGDVHRGMVSGTPSAYFEGTTLDQDGTVDFYRPFADVLQDIFDEQSFIQGINWVSQIPVQYIPYLGFLIGWDPPYFSSINDDIRKAFIKNARKLQRLKGSKRAIWELFEIFGFTIDIVNLWYRSDGNAFIGPNDTPAKGFENDYVTSESICTTEPMVADSGDSGFGDITVPLLYRPSGNFTIEAWLAKGKSRDDLNSIVNQSVINPTSLEQTFCSSTPDGMLISDAFDDVDMSEIDGHAKVLVDYESGIGLMDLSAGYAPISENGITYDKDTNQVRIIYDKYLDLSEYKLFVFAIYNREKITPSPSLVDLRSNRFDIQVLLFKDGEQPDSDLYDFLLDFLFKIKAFHSLLRKIIFTVETNDTYNVTDFCLGGLNKQSAGTSAGDLQVPPPIIPTDPTCASDRANRGFTQEDLALRESIISGLYEEHQAWKDLDGSHSVPADIKPIIDSLSRIPIPEPETTPCEFTQYGQDRVVQNSTLDTDQNPDTRAKLCSLIGNTKDYCYKGRAKDLLDVDQIVSLPESYRCNPCALMLGEGLYWSASLSSPPARWTNKENINKSWSDSKFVGKAAWNDSLHYTNRSLVDPEESPDAFLAIRRPSLDITKNNLFFPGHRFIEVFGLLDTFTHPTYGFRPWDDLLNLPCPEDVPLENGHPVSIPDLSTRIEIDTDGNEWLYFDDVSLTYYGNGLPPDIPSLGDHGAGTESGIESSEVTHAIYTSIGDLGSEEAYMEYDAMTITGDESTCTSDPIFNSANRSCECSDGIEDYVDGYPSESGFFSYDDSLGYLGNNTDRIVWERLLNIPSPASEMPEELLFKVGSGIRATDVKSYRLDCGCLYYSCDTAATATDLRIDGCNIEFFLDQAGDLSFECDKTDIFRTMILSESFSTCSYRLNGEITNLFTLDESKISIDTSGQIPIGRFKWADEWGTIFDVSFQSTGNTLDITWAVFEPRVWGESDTGFVDGRQVFRKGVITLRKQVTKIVDGQIYILTDLAEQSVGYFQSNLVCGDERFVDPFVFHVDCGITDDVEFDIECGPAWTDPSNPIDPSSWPTIEVDSSGNVIIGPVTGDAQIFYWINAWGNDEEITSNCYIDPTGTA